MSRKDKEDSIWGELFFVLIMLFIAWYAWVHINHYGEFDQFCKEQGYKEGPPYAYYNFDHSINSCIKDDCKYGSCKEIDVYPDPIAYKEWRKWVST